MSTSLNSRTYSRITLNFKDWLKVMGVDTELFWKNCKIKYNGGDAPHSTLVTKPPHNWLLAAFPWDTNLQGLSRDELLNLHREWGEGIKLMRTIGGTIEFGFPIKSKKMRVSNDSREVYTIGIDPGAKGAICLLQCVDGRPTEYIFVDHNKVPPLRIYAWVRYIQGILSISSVTLENVHSLPGMSAKSNFAFGGAFHTTQTILQIAEQEYELITPKVWQKRVGIPSPKKGIKRTSKELKYLVVGRCKELFPDCTIYGPRGGLLDGRSDALMIAYYGFLEHTQRREDECNNKPKD